jgi:hypothetical protein
MLAGAAVLLVGCAPAADASPDPATTVLICDTSPGSTCSAALLRTTAERVLLPALDGDPGAVLEVWPARGPASEAFLQFVAEEPPASMPKWLQDDWRNDRAGQALDSLARFESEFTNRPTTTRLIETVAKVALTATGRPPGRLYILTDAREVSGIGDWECGRIDPEAVRRTVFEGRRLLGPESLRGTHVVFVGVTHGAVDGARCDVDIERIVLIESTWRTVLLAAGAAAVEFHPGMPPTS